MKDNPLSLGKLLSYRTNLAGISWQKQTLFTYICPKQAKRDKQNQTIFQLFSRQRVCI